MELTKSKLQVLYLYVSTLVGVILGVFISIINTRYLDPVEYGDVHYVQNIINFFSGLMLFGYFVSGCRLLAIAKNKKEANEIKGAMTLILGATVIVMMIIMALCGVIHSFILHKPFAHLFYYVIPFSGYALCLNYINTSSQGDNSIGTIALARLLPSVIYLASIAIVFKLWGATSMIALLLNSGISFCILVSLILLNKPSFKNLHQSWDSLKEENKKYGFHVYLGSVSNVSVQYIAGMTLGLFAVNNVNVGYYSLALTATAPLMMLPNVIGTTYFKRFATQKRIERKVLVTTFIMAIVTLVCFDSLIYPIVDFLFNDKYQIVAQYAAFLALASTLHGLGDVFNRFLGAHGKGKCLRNGAFVSGGVALVGYTLGVYLWGINGAISTRIAFALTYFAMMAFYYLQLTKLYNYDKNNK
jgi:O-antigen/teichoic acid export membrane protein